jgi:hypothetical protein
MLVEATRIRRQEGVSLMWNTETTDGPGLRVVFAQAEPRSPASDHRFAIAEFHRVQGRIVASLGAAGRAVTAGMTRSGAWWLAQQHDHALGLVLGRALAHEIGHFLLGAAEHARRGLMRASFPARDLVDPRAAKFFLLDDGGAELLSARLEAGLLTPTAATH